MATTTETRQPVCPYLPPEIWHRILLEHAKDNNRTELWTFGRRVCSPWRSEIAKVFAKKYLENGNLVQIEPHFGSSTDRPHLHFERLTATFVFDRYEQNNKHRCVFKEAPDSIAKRDKAYDGKMFAAFEERVELYLGTDSKAARFDLPPCRIQVGPRVNDTELPNLKYDSQKREISFEWEGTFTRFFREATVLERLEGKIKAEAKQWFADNDDPAKKFTRKITARALARRHKDARRDTAKRIRRSRIKESYLEHHGLDFKDERFDAEEENKALNHIERWQDYSVLADCTETPEEKLTAKSFAEYWKSLGSIDFGWDPADYGAIKLDNMWARSALGRLVWPRPGSDVSEDEMDYDTMVDIYYEATPPYDGPEYDEWGNEYDAEGYQLDECGNRLEESEEEDDEVPAEDVRRTENGPLPLSKVDQPDEWGGLSDWEEEEQTW
jgi:hypothetical protein